MRVYAPIAGLTLCTLVGLAAALFGDGLWNVVGWVGLGIPAVLLIVRLVSPRFR
ncbi:MAG: hypothetical protein AAF211_25905 [Myxococcota bacterium]